MTTSFKKLLLISITMLLGVMSGGVRAQTNYNFTETYYLGGFLANGTETLSGSFQTTTGSGAQTILGWSNLTFGTNTNPSLNPGATYFPSPGAWAPTGTYNRGVEFPSGSGNEPVLLLQASTLNGWGYYSWSVQLSSNNITPCMSADCQSLGNWWGGQGATITLATGGAPEIDGSLAPKVGFLLGCLFLMFGRKKQDAEPMMTA